tara:strand:- start:914 stop:1246 length:333 start_codon:yes stop_codon:yes gene_type:complete
MEYKGISAGRLRHQLDFQTTDGTSDADGQVAYVHAFHARAEVQVKSGSDSVALGYEATAEIVTCLMWYNASVTNNLKFIWRGNTYTVEHVKPNTNKREMIVTGKVDGRIN